MTPSQQPTALFVGRYQPFHDGHFALVAEGIRRVGRACIAIRNTHGIDDKNPFAASDVSAAIRRRMNDGGFEEGRDFEIVCLPNITHIFYGRDVGYRVEQIELPRHLQEISATAIRRQLAESRSGEAGSM